LKFHVNETYDAETETIPRHWSDGIETRPRCSKNASRPSRDRDVRDRDYNPAAYCYHKICMPGSTEVEKTVSNMAKFCSFATRLFCHCPLLIKYSAAWIFETSNRIE